MKTRTLLAAVAGLLLPVCAAVLNATPIAGAKVMEKPFASLMPRECPIFGAGALIELAEKRPQPAAQTIDWTADILAERRGASDPEEAAGRPFDLLRTMPGGYASLMLLCGTALLAVSLALGYAGTKELPYTRTGSVHVVGGRAPVPALVLAKAPRSVPR